MPLTDFLEASGKCVHAGVTGCLYESRAGEIWVSKAAIKGVDANLWGALKHCVDVLGIKVNINSIDTGKHAYNSRHYQGRAVDINKIDRMDAGIAAPTHQAMLDNVEALRLVNYLLANGFKVGERNKWGSHSGILFGPIKSKYNPTLVEHSTHLHLGLVKRR